MTTSDSAGTPASNPAAAAYATALGPFSDVVASVPSDAWEAQSPCEEWTTRDVLDHVVSTQRQFLTERGFELGEAPDLAADPVAGWRRHVDDVTPIVEDAEKMATEYESYFGPATVGDTLERFHVLDLIVHRWDLATGAGLRTTFSDDEMDKVEADIAALGESLHAPGVCGPAVPVADDADRQTKLLGEMGRTA